MTHAALPDGVRSGWRKRHGGWRAYQRWRRAARTGGTPAVCYLARRRKSSARAHRPHANCTHINKEISMSFVSEFKAFAMKGNVVDLAVGVIIGAAFGKIVDSVVADLIMPIVGAIFGGLDFSQFFIVLKDIPPGVPETLADLKKAGVPVFAWGSFLTIALNFVILAFIIFIMVKQINRLKREEAAEPAPPAEPPEEVVLLRQIRDSLSK